MSHTGYPAAISLCLGFAHGHPRGMGCGKEARNAVGLSGMAGAARER